MNKLFLVLGICMMTFVLTCATAYAVDGENHAAVVIDTGTHVQTACITFTGDSISGARALELASADPVFRSFSGQGKAVCALCGVGCPPDDSCLTCAGSKFWNYFRSSAGTTSFSLSSVGASNSVVKPGDVEGWRFGVGQKPPYISYNTVCGIDVSQPLPQTITVPLPSGSSTTNKATTTTYESGSVSVSGITATRSDATTAKNKLAAGVRSAENEGSALPLRFGAGFIVVVGIAGMGFVISRHRRVHH